MIAKKTFKNYKKRLAFTLAEVLISLLVIGVVASIVIPGAINNVQEFQYKVAWKTAHTILVQATKSVVQERSSLLNQGATGYLGTMYQPYLKYVQFCPYSTSTYGNCWAEAYNDYAGAYASGMKLSNGMYVLFSYYDENNPNTNYILVDVNGHKKPNSVGKDIFVTNMKSDGKGIQPLNGNCDPNAASVYDRAGCSYKYIYN